MGKLLSITMLSFLATQALALAPNSVTEGSRAEPSIVQEFNSSPNDVNQLLSSLERENQSLIPSTFLTPWFKQFQHDVEGLNERTGFNFGFEYIPLYQHSNLGAEKQNTGGGEFELFGRWKILGAETTTPLIGFKVEQKHKYTEIPPSEFAEEELHSIIRTVSGYEPLRAAITELWFQQFFPNERIGLRIGKIDITSIMNSYAFDSRKFYFLSNVFTSHPAKARPVRALGMILGFKLSKHLYVVGGIADANGQEGTSGFNTIGEGEFFSAVEFGYRQTVSNPQSDNYHIFFWHVDARKKLGLPSDRGVSILLQKSFNYLFIPFIKIESNRGRTREIKKLLLGGFGLQHPFGGKFGLLGMGVGRAMLSEAEYSKQFIFETFWRIQLSPFTQITPDIQLIRTIAYPGEPGEHGEPGMSGRVAKWAPVASVRFRTAV